MPLLPRASDLPVRERHELPGWIVVVRSDLGLVRERLEDAWRILPGATLGGRRVHALAVFDGLGGLPYGQEAAWAAAEHLPDALASSTGPGDVLAHLNNWVRQTQGTTTAAVAFLPPATGEGTLLSIGDSAAYALDAAGAAVLLNEKDSDGPHVLTDYLGHAEARGHEASLAVPRGGALLLCSDGVDGVVDAATITRTLRAPDMAGAVEDLFADVVERGAPDNATVVVARRTT